MVNQVKLTDDELSVIVASLQLTIMSHEKYVQQNGEGELHLATINTINQIKSLYERLDKEYF